MDQIVYQEAIQDNGVGVKLKDLNPRGEGEGVFEYVDGSRFEGCMR